MSFTVFSYNATVLLIQPNPTHGWTQPMSISAWTQQRRDRPSGGPSVRRSVGRADAEVVNFVAGLQNNIVRRRLAQTRRV